MKILSFSVLAFLVSLRIFAQSASSVSVNIRYSIDPLDISDSKIFLSRVQGKLTADDRQKLLDLTASRILMKVKTGDSVAIYDPIYEILPGFSPWTRITDCGKLTPADLEKPANQVGEQSWLTSEKHNYFRFKKGNAVAEKDKTVFADKKIAYSADENLIFDKKGKNEHTVIIYSYLNPENVSVFFAENWIFDYVKGGFTKKINFYGYWVPKETAAGDAVGYTPELCIANPFFMPQPTKDILIKKNVVCDVAVDWPTEMLENDSSTMRMKASDAINYISSTEGNIPENDRAKFISSIFSFAYHNLANVFPVKGNVVDSIHPFQSSKLLNDIFCLHMPIQVEDPNNPGTFFTSDLVTEKFIYDVYAIRFYEDWYYDAKEFTLKKVVRGLGLILEDHSSEDGELMLQDAGIYIKMN